MLTLSARIFDALEAKWECPSGQKLQGSTLVFSFIFFILLIEINRRNLLPDTLAELVPRKHLVAIEWAFLLLLIYEVISLTLSLAKSTSTSLRKQFEVLSLFLLRDTFKEFSHFTEPLDWKKIEPSIIPIVSTSLAALVIFVILIFFHKQQRRHPFAKDKGDTTYYIAAKKFIAMVLLASFLFIIGLNGWNYLAHGHTETAFETFYTVLIFSDILIVLLSIRYSASYLITFRNSGFAVATVMIRLSLIAPLVISSFLGVGAALFALGVLVAFNFSVPIMGHVETKT